MRAASSPTSAASGSTTPPVIAGRAVLVGTDGEGNYVDCPVPLGIALQVVNWRHEQFDYAPPPLQIIEFDSIDEMQAFMSGNRH